MQNKHSLVATVALAFALTNSSTSLADHHEEGESTGKTQTTSSGLVITELKPGSDRHPKASDTVVVHYHGTFEDGRVFDSSVQRGKPATFPLRRVIKCWTEGLQLIGIGGKSKLVCPGKIAYGPRGRPPKIPPNATLIFEVELLDIK